MDFETYMPVNCGFHDRLLDFATRKEAVRVVLKDDASTKFDARILDVFTENGSEFIQFDNGLKVRLDRLQMVEGFLPEGGACAM